MVRLICYVTRRGITKSCLHFHISFLHCSSISRYYCITWKTLNAISCLFGLQLFLQNTCSDASSGFQLTLSQWIPFNVKGNLDMWRFLRFNWNLQMNYWYSNWLDLITQLGSIRQQNATWKIVLHKIMIGECIWKVTVYTSYCVYELCCLFLVTICIHWNDHQ